MATQIEDADCSVMCKICRKFIMSFVVKQSIVRKSMYTSIDIQCCMRGSSSALKMILSGLCPVVEHINRDNDESYFYCYFY